MDTRIVSKSTLAPLEDFDSSSPTYRNKVLLCALRGLGNLKIVNNSGLSISIICEKPISDLMWL